MKPTVLVEVETELLRRRAMHLEVLLFQLDNALTRNSKVVTRMTSTRTEGVIGLTRWFEKMEFVFHISDCAESCQVKYATCTLQGEALTWWNSYVKSTNLEAAYAIGWKELKEMLIEEYYPSQEIQNMEAKLWNLTIDISDVVGYRRRFQELALLCPNIVPIEKKKIDRYVWGLPDDIQRNVIALKPAKIGEAIRVAQELNKKKVRNKAAKAVENKRKWEGTNHNYHGNNQNQPHHQNKRQGIVRAYATGASNRGGYVGRAPQCASANFTTMGIVVRCVGTASVLIIKLRIVVHLLELPSLALDAGRKDTTSMSVPREKTLEL
ncbi:reverse transcriptase domain-containing protein [Tanacetum coccineum]